MTWLGLRLTLGGGLRSATGFLLTALVVGVGSALVLLALCVAPAMQSRADRTAWLDAEIYGAPATPASSSYTLVAGLGDTYGSSGITVVDVAGVGAAAPKPPGMASLPAPGHVVVSAALRRLMSSQPELARRYGVLDATLPAEVVDGPDSLVAVRGVTTDHVAASGTAVTAFPTSGEVLELTGAVRLLMLLGTVAMVAPLALLVAMSTRLTAVTRAQRLAALRLAGATTGQAARLTLVESVALALFGLALGAVLFLLVRPLAAYVSYDGQRWAVDDLSPGLAGWLVAVVAVPVAVIVAASRTLMRVAADPLGVARRSSRRVPGKWRLAPLLGAVPLLWLSVGSGSGGDRGLSIASAFAVLLATLMLAGPVITRGIGLLLARPSSPAALLAGRRLSDDPQTCFRPVGAAALAVLTVTLFAAATPAAAESLSNSPVTGQQDGTASADIYFATPERAAALLKEVRSLDGVAAAALVYEGVVQDAGQAGTAWIGDCRELVAASRLSSIPCDEAPVLSADGSLVTGVAGIEVASLGSRQVTGYREPSPEGAVTSILVPAAQAAQMPRLTGVDVPTVVVSSALLPPSVLASLRPTRLLVSYDAVETLERVRTSVVSSVPLGSVATRESTLDGYSSDVRTLYRVVAVGAVGVAALASLALVVAVTAGLLERRRPLALLLAAGTPMGVLRRSVVLESAAPLVVMVVLAAGLGTLVGHWSVAQTSTSTDLPLRGLLLPPVTALVVGLVMASVPVLLLRSITRDDRTTFV